MNEFIENNEGRLPEGVHLTTWQNQAKVLRDRLDLLIRNGIAGLILVFISLALFLRFRLAFWVSLGIPLSFLGAAWMMPWMGVSVNLISLFAFIVVLGIVVDDAIVAAENIYAHQQRHGDGLRGVVEGAQEISTPVIFAMLTTVAAFFPLMMAGVSIWTVSWIPATGFSAASPQSGGWKSCATPKWALSALQEPPGSCS